MKLKVKTTISAGTLYFRLRNSQNSAIDRKLIGKDEYEFEVVILILKKLMDFEIRAIGKN